MASYYGLSSLMISATAARSSHEGFLKRRRVIFSPALGEEKNYHLRYGIVEPEIDIGSSILSTRGWAAQERMLAPRIIHYTRRQMIWECAEGLACEASGPVASGPYKFVSPLLYNYPILQKRRLQPLFTAALVGANSPCRIPLDDAENGMPLLLQAWYNCVTDYSNCHLTMPSDKLHAVAGIATLLNNSGKLGHYLAGIWTERLVFHLAWGKHEEHLFPKKDYRAPSWSWASLDGRVTYDTMPRWEEVHKSLSDETKKERA